MHVPATHRVSVERAMQTLDHAEMMVLSEMYERWAFTEPKLDGDQRTRLIQMSADYERIAEFAGVEWRASHPDSEADVVKFAAQQELRARSISA